MKLIVGITGGSGVIYGIKLLETLFELNIESHLIISEWGEKTIRIEQISVLNTLSRLHLQITTLIIWHLRYPAGRLSQMAW